MDLRVSDDLSAEDIPAITLGLYHTAKVVAASGRDPKNAVEFTLVERANDAFQVYLNGMHKSTMALMENS